MIRRWNKDGNPEVVRPTFDHAGPSNHGTWPQDQCAAQLLEDIRNVLESIQRSQMLQCDVRAEIREMRDSLRRIAKNTSRKRRKANDHKR